jgi:hypothetical protein
MFISIPDISIADIIVIRTLQLYVITHITILHHSTSRKLPNEEDDQSDPQISNTSDPRTDTTV